MSEPHPADRFGRMAMSVGRFVQDRRVHGRMARGGHGLPNVLLRPAMRMPCYAFYALQAGHPWNGLTMYRNFSTLQLFNFNVFSEFTGGHLADGHFTGSHHAGGLSVS
jgi:hypothetical protein